MGGGGATGGGEVESDCCCARSAVSIGSCVDFTCLLAVVLVFALTFVPVQVECGFNTTE